LQFGEENKLHVLPTDSCFWKKFGCLATEFGKDKNQKYDFPNGFVDIPYKVIIFIVNFIIISVTY